MWNVEKAVKHLTFHAESESTGYCARYVKKAISAGGEIEAWPNIESAKDYGRALIDRGFEIISADKGLIRGDVVIIQGIKKIDFPKGLIKKDHPHGHMAMFDGTQWVSDFKQNQGYYPGKDYVKAKPAYVFYRHKDVSGGDDTRNAIKKNSRKNIFYPIRNNDGKQFSSLDEVMRLVDGEAHGTWLLGTNGLWHGGIHISDVSNPFSVLKPDALNTKDPVPLQFMADGTVVAYRLNSEYLTAPYCGQQLRFSSSFVLVKSQCRPDPQKENSWLEFYSLYMHLAPVSDYPASACYKVKDGHSGIRLRQYKNGQNGLPEGAPDNGEAGRYPAPAKTGKSLKAGDRFVSSRTERFYVTDKGKVTLTTFGLVRLLKGNIPQTEQYWVTLAPELMVPDGEIQELMPEWMQRAKQKGAFDSVELTGETEEWTVSAGTPVGFMGCTESPGEGNNLVDKEWFVHLEVLSTDTRMPGFLANPEGVEGDKRSVLAPKEKNLFIRQDTAGQQVFTPTSARLSAQCLLTRESTTPVADESRNWWYKITENGWLPQSDVEDVKQYDLLKLGFQALEENNASDVMDSPYESWVPQAFNAVSLSAEQGADYQYSLVPPFYRELMAEMDSNRDGKVTAEEIRQALAVRDPLVKNVVNRLAVKHHSEWSKGRSTGRWEGFYKDLDSLEVKYCEKWQADLEWMSRVPPFDKDEAVWHFHPVVFLDSIKKISTGWAHSPFANLLGRIESRNDYTAHNVTRTGSSVPHYNTNLTSMCISEVMQAQKDRDMFATGRFQIIPATLQDAVNVLQLDTSELYNEEIQDRIFEEYIIKVKRPSFINYLEGTGSVEDAIYDWAKEFASAGVRKGNSISPKKIPVLDDNGLPVYENGKKKYILVPRTAQIEGESYYAGDGFNKAHLLPDEMVRALEESKNEFQ
ncbi:EF-hand domain-containing protein [Leclercia adecarboxylata]|uniref:EF-hand domain-containing protein n=1 Tax=Leclercia adecarboxylata TaxID=83655 RepID=UPI001FB015A5|nr:EF-hand domain-containing protein [Leclercia adecarboxylata]